MNIAGLQKTTLVDYPGKIAATVFTRGCSFRCPFCHNPELVIPEKFNPLVDENEIWDFFEKRKNQLDGICITGGEPTIQKGLPEFIARLKDLGYAVKLDTNGSSPSAVEALIKSGNLDYIAMDIKSAPNKYLAAAGIMNHELGIKNNTACHSREGGNPENLISNIKQSIALIMQSGIEYEFRTTVCHPIHEVADFEEIGKLIKDAKRYFIQNFVKSKQIDDHQNFIPFSDEELESSKKNIRHHVKRVEIR
jgi:pyruvate formate lyase activating enzyme